MEDAKRSDERDMLVRAVKTETQLDESIKTISGIRNDLGSIYDRIEKLARQMLEMSGKNELLKETTQYKIEEIGKKILSLESSISEASDLLSTESKGRASFETTILSSFRTTKIIVSLISALAILTVAILSYLKH